MEAEESAFLIWPPCWRATPHLRKTNPRVPPGLPATCSLDVPVSHTACNLYIWGLEHMLNTLQIHGRIRQIDCSPDSSTSNQIRDIFIRYLRANPQS